MVQFVGWFHKQSEVRKALIFIFFFFMMYYLPWVCVKIICPDDYVTYGYRGGSLDYLSYLVKMELGRQGLWVYENRFGEEKLEPIHAYYYYLFIGHLARWLNVSTLEVYYFISSLTFAVSLWLWWCICRKRENAIWLFLSIFILYTGLNVFAKLWNDIIKVEHLYLNSAILIYVSVIMTGCVGFSHYLLEAIGFMLIYLTYRDRKNLLYSLIGGFAIGVVHPNLLIVPIVLFTAHCLLFDRRDLVRVLKMNCLILIGGGVFLVTLFIDYMTIDWIKDWRSQTGCGRIFGNLVEFVLSCSVVSLFSFFNLRYALKSKDKDLQIAGIWVIPALLMSVFGDYIIGGGREFAMWSGIGMNILGIDYIFRHVNKYKIFIQAFILLLFIVNISVFVCDSKVYYDVNIHDKEAIANIYSDSKKFIEGLKWLEVHSKDGEVALTTPFTGGRFPLYISYPRPYIGHFCETLRYYNKLSNVQDILLGGRFYSYIKEDFVTDKELIEYIKAIRDNKPLSEFDWVVVTPAEVEYLGMKVPGEIVYQNEAIIISKILKTS